LKPLSVIYWSRVCLGITAALISGVLGLFLNINLMNGVGIVLIFYILTNYILRRWFVGKWGEASEDIKKVFTTGIGAYFIMWVVTWILVYTITHPSG
jgi:hypothetical protein